MIMKRKFGEIIGERQLSRIGSPEKVTTIALGKPRRKKDGDWECPFLITGSKIQYGYGVDALQALTTALEGVRVMLEQSGKTFSLLGGEPGYTGFDRPIPSSLGAKFNVRLNRILDREIANFVDGLERAHQEKKKEPLLRVRHRRDGADRKNREGGSQ